jgi:hypothetical protein
MSAIDTKGTEQHLAVDGRSKATLAQLRASWISIHLIYLVANFSCIIPRLIKHMVSVAADTLATEQGREPSPWRHLLLGDSVVGI